MDSTALGQHLPEADTTRSVSALQTWNHPFARPADDRKGLAVSLRSAVLRGLVRSRTRKAGGDSKAKRKTGTSVSRQEKGKGNGKAQSTEARLDAGPSTPPPSEDITAESSPRDAVDVVGLASSLGEQDEVQDQEQPQAEEVEAEAVPAMARSVSFNEVVMEVLIEDRHKTYGSRVSRRQHFYSKAELEIFKRAWYWHVKASSNRWPVDRLLRCGCPGCDKDEGRVPVLEDRDTDYSHWTWEG